MPDRRAPSPVTEAVALLRDYEDHLDDLIEDLVDTNLTETARKQKERVKRAIRALGGAP